MQPKIEISEKKLIQRKKQKNLTIYPAKNCKKEVLSTNRTISEVPLFPICRNIQPLKTRHFPSLV